VSALVNAELGASEKRGAGAPGVGPATPYWVLESNFRLRIGTIEKSASYEISVNLLNIKERQKPKQLKKNLSRRSPRGLLGYFVTFWPDRATPTNALGPAETGAVLVFCDISTVETSNFTIGLGPIRSDFSGYGTKQSDGVFVVLPLKTAAFSISSILSIKTISAPGSWPFCSRLASP
jgi:hypothetical protein